MNQNCCFPKQVRCQIIINFTVHIVTVFSAQISGAARVARYALGGGSGQCKMQTADCRLQTGGKMQTRGKMQTKL